MTLLYDVEIRHPGMGLACSNATAATQRPRAALLAENCGAQYLIDGALVAMSL
jgi:hypothetical protein